MVLVSGPLSPDGVVPEPDEGAPELSNCVAVRWEEPPFFSWLKGRLRQQAEELDLLVSTLPAVSSSKREGSGFDCSSDCSGVFFTTLDKSKQKMDERRNGQSSSSACSSDKMLHSGGKWGGGNVVLAVEMLS